MKYTIELQRITSEKLIAFLADKLSKAYNRDINEVREELKKGGCIYAKDIDKEEVLHNCALLKKLSISYVVHQIETPNIKHATYTPPPKESLKEERVFHSHLYDTPPPKKSASISQILLIVAILIAVGLAISLLSRIDGERESVAPKSGTIRSSRGSSQDAVPTPATALEAAELTKEAADICGRDGSSAVRLYRAAISFNRKNLPAWQGLLNCYETNNLHGEAAETRKEMMEIFGPTVFSLSSALSQLNGDILSVDESKQQYTVTYHNENMSREQLLREAFTIIRSVATTTDAESIYVIATGRSGDGVLISIPRQPTPESFRQMMSMARVTEI